MSKDANRIYKLTLANGTVFSIRSYYGTSQFEGALAGTDYSLHEYAEGEAHVNNWSDFRNCIGSEKWNGLRAAALEAQLEMNPPRPVIQPNLELPQTFTTAVRELCITAHLGFDPTEPMRTLQALIQWHVQVALDPSVSESQSNLYKQILDRNEFLARKILPILDDVPTANVDETVLSTLKMFVDESPGDRPYVFNEWEPEPEVNLPIGPEEIDLMLDVEAGRRAAAERKANKPKWLIKQEREKSMGQKLMDRRKALPIKREMLANLTGETVKTISRVENGLPMLGATRIRNKMRNQLANLERLVVRSN